MTERLKVFKNIENQVTTNKTVTVNLLNTDSTEQAVITNLKVTAKDKIYPINMQLSINGIPILPIESGAPLIVDATGKQIVDTSSSVDVIIDTEDIFYYEKVSTLSYLSKTDAILFNGSDSYLIKDTSTDDRKNIAAIPYSTIIEDIESTKINNSDFSASSAFGWIDTVTQEKKYTRVYSNSIYTYNYLGELIQTSSFSSGYGTVYGACTDGTYFYGKSNSSDTIIQRIVISSGVPTTYLTTNLSVSGQNYNQGSYTLYYNGFIYIKQSGTTTTVYKINTINGAVTLLTVPNGGFYSAGGIITVAGDGTPYLIEYCATHTIVINLSTFSLVTETWPTDNALSLSTEYGNCALEISAGVVVFFYGLKHLYFDVNTMTRSDAINNSITNLPPTIYNYSSYNSIANIPLYTNYIGALAKPRNITYSIYADGVEITGV